MARKVIGQVAVEFEQEAKEPITDFALCKRTRWCCLLVYPVLKSVSVRSSFHRGLRTYWSATDVRDGVACGIFGGIAEQDVCFGIVFTLIRGVAFVWRHICVLNTVGRSANVYRGGLSIQNFGGAGAVGLLSQPDRFACCLDRALQQSSHACPPGLLS